MSYIDDGADDMHKGVTNNDMIDEDNCDETNSDNNNNKIAINTTYEMTAAATITR